MKLLIALLTIAMACRASATIIYDSGPSANTDGQKSDFDGGQQYGGQFTLAGGFTLQSVEWWGAYAFSNTPQAVDNFSVLIYLVTGGTPSLTPMSQFSLSGVVRTATAGKIGGQFTVYRYTSALPSIALGAGTYVFSLMNNTTSDTNDDWFWANSSDTSKTAWKRNNATSIWAKVDGDFPPSPIANVAFNISGIAGVPEPGTVSLLAVAGVFFSFRRGRTTRASRGRVSRC